MFRTINVNARVVFISITYEAKNTVRINIQAQSAESNLSNVCKICSIVADSV